LQLVSLNLAPTELTIFSLCVESPVKKQCWRWIKTDQTSRAPLKIHFGGQANLFDSGRRQEKSALASAKADFPSLPEYKNLLLTAQKQLLEKPLTILIVYGM